MTKKLLSIILSLIIVFEGSIHIFAHESVLNVEYDDCGVLIDKNGNVIKMDGEDETWYWLSGANNEYHISHDVQNITYYFSNTAKDDATYTWTTELSESEAEEIKQAYAESMEKWNDVYYCSYDENGHMILHKVINVVEGTNETNSNLIIYPTNTSRVYLEGRSNPYNASTRYIDDIGSSIENMFGKDHNHYQKWFMKVNIDFFKSSYSDSSIVRERTGQHELGHVLGLRDVDNLCSASNLSYHHEELLMGYGNLSDRSTYAKYKDIAGVAITRGFHTDDDHVWMLRTNSDGTKDVICAQCNGVRYNVSLTDGKYEGKTVNEYKSCVHHNGTNQKMLLVATDGDRYFYKCQYCRYIATFEEENATHVSANGTNFDINLSIPANSEIYYRVVVYDTFAYNLKSSNYDIDISLCDSNLNILDIDLSDASTSDGVDVSLLDDNTYYLKIENNYNVEKNVAISLYGSHTHSFDYWVYVNETTHRSECSCGVSGNTTAPHAFMQATFPNLGAMICVGCGYTKMPGGSIGQIIKSINKVSINGSYILHDGTIMLVEEDIEAYLNGTLVFYDRDKLPVTQ